MLQNLPKEVLHQQSIRRLAAAGLLGFARTPADPATLAFAGLIARNRSAQCAVSTLQLPGLDEAGAYALVDRYFPGAADYFGCAAAPLPDARDTEYQDLLTLLLDHGAGDEETRWVALAVAAACLGQNHLWQDLGLPDRKVLSALLARYFPSLAAKNVRDMKWKKFFYKQLCERAEIFVCKAPSCGVCTDYQKCFGPEEA